MCDFASAFWVIQKAAYCVNIIISDEAVFHHFGGVHHKIQVYWTQNNPQVEWIYIAVSTQKQSYSTAETVWPLADINSSLKPAGVSPLVKARMLFAMSSIDNLQPSFNQYLTRRAAYDEAVVLWACAIWVSLITFRGCSRGCSTVIFAVWLINLVVENRFTKDFGVWTRISSCYWRNVTGGFLRQLGV